MERLMQPNGIGRILGATLALLGGLLAAPAVVAQNIYTVAGSANYGYAGDGGSATSAMLDKPAGVAVAEDGSIYIADTSNWRIRKVDPYGNISTFASADLPFDLDIDAEGNLYVGGHNSVYKISPDGVSVKIAGGISGFSGDGGPAANAGLGAWIRGIAVDGAGNIFIADTENHRVRKIDTNGIITTVAGNGVGTNYGDGGPANMASLNTPYDVDVDAEGNVYIADTLNARVRVVSKSGIITTRLADSNGVWFVAVDERNAVYYGGRSSHRITKVDFAGFTHIAGTAPGFGGDEASASSAQLYQPAGIGFDAAGNLHVADSGNSRIRKIVLNDITTFSSDYDGDGWADILWRNIVTGANALWLTANHATQKSVAPVTSSGWYIAAQGDFNADGVSDIWWRNANTGANIIWHSAEQARAVTATRVSNLSWQIVGTGDFNGDGASDLLWRNMSTGAGSVWYSGRSATALTLSSVSLAWEIVGVGDFNADGKSDILWRSRDSGANVIWKSGLRSTQQPVTGVTNLDWKIVGAGDFDGEGHSDILWRNMRHGANVIWKAGDSKRTQAVTGVGNQLWQIKDIADYDGDRKSDILWHHQNGSSVIWRSGMSSSQLPVRGVSDQNWAIAP